MWRRRRRQLRRPRRRWPQGIRGNCRGMWCTLSPPSSSSRGVFFLWTRSIPQRRVDKLDVQVISSPRDSAVLQEKTPSEEENHLTTEEPAGDLLTTERCSSITTRCLADVAHHTVFRPIQIAAMWTLPVSRLPRVGRAPAEVAKHPVWEVDVVAEGAFPRPWRCSPGNQGLRAPGVIINNTTNIIIDFFFFFVLLPRVQLLLLRGRNDDDLTTTTT